MTEIPQAAINAAELAIHQLRNRQHHRHTRGETCYRVTAVDTAMARAALEAAEAAWPHHAPDRAAVHAETALGPPPDFTGPVL